LLCIYFILSIATAKINVLIRMNKRLLSFIVLFVSIVRLNAQGFDTLGVNASGPKKAYSFGIKIGGNSSRFTGLPERTERQLGFSAGFFASYKISNRLSAQLEVVYMQQGGTYLSHDSLPPATSVKSANTITLHNIEIPLLLKYNLPGICVDKLQLLIGPALGINVAASNYYISDILFNSGREVIASGTETVSSDYLTFQWGAYFGLARNFTIGSSYLLTVDFRYRLGLSPVIDLNNYYTINPNLMLTKSNTLALTVGFGF